MNTPLWRYCRALLEKQMTSHEFNTWIRPLQVIEESGQLLLLAPNPYVLQRVRQHFLEKIEAIVAERKSASGIRIVLKVGGREAPAINAARPEKGEPEPMPAAGVLNPAYTFDRFVTGQSNQLAHAASLQLVQGTDFNPLFIHGGVGLGKTHLMQAVGHQVRMALPHAKIAYVHAEQFVANLINALNTKKMAEFKQSCRAVDVLLFDDVQFLAGKKRSEEEFLHTLSALMDRNQRVVVTGNQMPSQMAMEERIQTRLSSGLSVMVQKPELDTRVEILRAKARQRQILLSDEVAHYIASHLDRSVRELEGALNRLKATASLLNQKITLDFSREALADLLESAPARGPLTIDEIQQVVAQYYSVSIEELCSKRRHKHIVRPRQVAMHLAKSLTEHPMPVIGKAFGGRDRTTVVYSCKTIEGLKNNDPKLSQDYGNLVESLGRK